MIPILKDSVQIRKTSHVCVIRDVRKPISSMLELAPLETVVLALCDGSRDAAAIADCIPRALTDVLDEDAVAYVERILTERKSLFNWREQPGQPSGRYRPSDFLYVPAKPSPTGRFISPIRASLLLTYRCNFHCVYCYNGSGPAHADHLSTADWLEAIRQLSGETECQSIHLCGGEPLIHPGFYDILNAGMKANMIMDVTTNGSLIDRDAAKRLADIGLQYILVSLDTPSPDAHHQLTGTTHTFDKVTSAIEQLVKAGIAVHVKALLYDGNYQDVVKLTKLVEDLGAAGILFDVFDRTNIGRGACVMGLSQEHYDAVVANRENVEGRLVYQTNDKTRDWQTKNQVAVCGAWRRSMEIGPTGAYDLCETLSADPFFDLGTFPKDSIMDAWRSPRIDEILYPDEALCDPECRACALFSYCRTGCFKNKLTYGGGHYDRDPKCKLDDSLRFPNR